MSKRPQGPWVRKLIVRFIAVEAIPRGGGLEGNVSDTYTVPLSDFHQACAERDEARKVACILWYERRDGLLAWDGTEWLIAREILERYPWLGYRYPWLEVSSE